MPNHPIPLTPLRPVQRIAWLDGVRSLECTADFGGTCAPSHVSAARAERTLHPFTAGNRYPIATALRETAVASERENITGENEVVTTHGREFTVTVYEKADTATGMGRAHHFSDYPLELMEKSPERLHPFADLLSHFAIPEVPDIAQTFPAQYQRALAWLADFEQRANRTLPKDSALRGEDGKFTLTDYQREDLARGACIPEFNAETQRRREEAEIAHSNPSSSASPRLRVSSYIHRIKCVERPSLATLVADCFDYVGADEGVRLKADDSFMSLGVRRLNPSRRLVLTGTPVKNQLHDIFWLLEWASHGGAVLGWEQGLGKSLALLFYGHLTGCQRHLLIAPEGLHEAIRRTAAAFGLEIRTLDSQSAFQRDPLLAQWQRDHLAGRPSEAAGMWLTSYTQLGLNGADEEIRPKPNGVGEVGIGEVIAYRIQRRDAETQRKSPADMSEYEWQRNLQTAQRTRNRGTVAEKKAAVAEMQHLLAGLPEIIVSGLSRREPSHSEVVAKITSSPRLCVSAFQNRFPYPATTEGRTQFAADFMPTEENHSKAIEHEQAYGKVKRFTKRVPGLTNRHRLWRILAGLIFRRTSDEVGTMVKLTHVPIILPPGKAQLAVYRHYVLQHLDTKDYSQRNQTYRLPFRKNVLAILKNLRLAALAPHSKLLPGMRSWTDACPKQAWTLAKIAQLIADGERVVVLSSFTDFGEALHRRLGEAGVASVNLDGSTTSAHRGLLAEQFKAGQFAVLCGTKASMGEGHSFECASHLIEPDDDWALDLNLQTPKRVHRINSKRPVTIWHLQTAKTIDARLAADRAQKTLTAGLALDLDFIPEEMHPAGPGSLLRDAIADFDEKAPCTDEQLIEDEWERGLRHKLRGAMAKFREHHPAIAGLVERAAPSRVSSEACAERPLHQGNVTKAEVRTAMTTLRKGRLVDAIPDGTLRFLAHLPAGANLTALRTEFEQFMVNNRDRTWQTAWPKFEAGRKAKRKPVTSHQSPVTAATNKDIPQPKDYRHLGI